MTGARRGGPVALLLLTAGCADRGLASAPPSPPSTLTWIVVAIAACAAALVMAALIVLPDGRSDGSPLAAGLLAVQAGAAVVGTAVLIGAAVRSEQLTTGEPRAEQAASLLRLTGLDGGDTGFFRLLIGLMVVLAALLVVVLVLGARFAAGNDPSERIVAGCVLAVESAIGGVALVLAVIGHRSLPFVVPAAALPLLLLGTISCWPTDRAEPGIVGYNERHG